jgi:hypothetical protein
MYVRVFMSTFVTTQHQQFHCGDYAGPPIIVVSANALVSAAIDDDDVAAADKTVAREEDGADDRNHRAFSMGAHVEWARRHQWRL